MNGTVTLPAQIKHLFLLMLLWISLQQSTQQRRVRTANKMWTWKTQISAAELLATGKQSEEASPHTTSAFPSTEVTT